MTTTAAPAAGRPPGVLAQSAILAGRSLSHWRAQPTPFVVNLLFPLFVLLLMTGLLGGALAGSPSGYIDYVVPGILAVTMLFGVEQTMLAITTDAARTITDRFRSLPIHAAAIVGGRCLADLLATVLGLAVTLAGGLVLGWRPTTGLGAAFAALALLLWSRLGLQALALWGGLRAAGPEVVVAVQILVWPVSMLSTVFVDPATMPRWLGAIAEANPLSATVTAVRELFGSPSAPSTTWAGEHALLLAVLLPAAFVLTFTPLAARRFRALSR